MSGISNQGIKIILVSLILIQCLVLLIGLRTDTLFILTVVLNLLTGVTIMVYWVIKQLRMTQHFFDRREIMVLSFEVCQVASAVWFFLYSADPGWLLIVHYSGFIFHTVGAVLLLVFAVTFKMKRLL